MPDASEVRSKMSAWPWSRVAVVPAGAVRMTAHVLASASDEAVAASVVAASASVESVAASVATASAVSRPTVAHEEGGGRKGHDGESPGSCAARVPVLRGVHGGSPLGTHI